MAYENKNFAENRGENRNESLFSKRIKAGKRRTYFFDVRSTRGNDYFITITESKKRFDDNGYDRHKMFIYKEDFNKFLIALSETINFVKTELMPDFDFELNYTVTGFTVFYTDKGMDIEEPGTGSNLTSKQKQALNGLTRGKNLMIKDIKAVGPDNKTRDLNAIILKIN